MDSLDCTTANARDRMRPAAHGPDRGDSERHLRAGLLVPGMHERQKGSCQQGIRLAKDDDSDGWSGAGGQGPREREGAGGRERGRAGGRAGGRRARRAGLQRKGHGLDVAGRRSEQAGGTWRLSSSRRHGGSRGCGPERLS